MIRALRRFAIRRRLREIERELDAERNRRARYLVTVANLQRSRLAAIAKLDRLTFSSQRSIFK